MSTGGLLVVMAHPDDESLIGGTMARYAAQGVFVTMLCATRGEAGEIAPGTGATRETLGAFRERELREACTILGVHDVRFLDFRDSGMRGTPENDDPRCLFRAAPERVVEPLVRAIRELRPSIVVTWDESGDYGHPDHVTIHCRTTQAFVAAADATRFASAGGPWRPRALFYGAIPIEEFERVMAELRERGFELGDPPGDDEAMRSLPRVPPNCILDVTGQYELKTRALEAHHTQIDSFGMFARMPDDVRRRFFSREYFYRAEPPLPGGTVLGDLFAGLP